MDKLGPLATMPKD